MGTSRSPVLSAASLQRTMRKAKSGLLGGLLCLALWPAGALAQDSLWEQDKKACAQSEASGTSQQVELQRLKELVAQNPNDAALRIALGNALDDSSDPHGAIAQYQEALRLEPDNAVAHRNLGLTYLRMEDWEAAETESRKALRLKPDYLAARCDLALTLVNKKDLEGGFQEYLRAIQQHRHGVAQIFGLHRPPSHWQEFERAQEEAAARLLVAMTLRGYGHLDKAIAELRTVIQLDPEFALARLHLGRSYVQAGKPEQGWNATQEAFQLNPSLRPGGGISEEQLARRKQEIDAFVRAQKKEDLERYLQGLEKASRSYLDHLERATKELAETKEPERQQALAWVTELEERLHDLASKLAANAEGWFELGELGKAIETIRKAISLDPENTQYREQLEKYEQANKVNR